MHDLVAELYLLDHEPGARRQQHLRIHRPPLGWPDDPSGRRGLPEYSGVVQLARANLDISPPQPGWRCHVCTGIASRLVNSMTTTACCTKFDPEPEISPHAVTSSFLPAGGHENSPGP